jgi:molybdenum cofactor cytidylyltransferase
MSVRSRPGIGAVVLAAGQSTRMGRPKLALPWGDTTVIGQVVQVLLNAGISEIVVVTGGAHQEVQQALQDKPARIVYNRDFRQKEMLSSLRLGLSAIGESRLAAALVVLGDQPQIEARVVKTMLELYASKQYALIVPSYRMRRGHPWLLDRSLWPVVMSLQEPHTLRDFLNEHQASITYLTVDTPTILQDLDTPGDYLKYKPG